MSKFLSLPLAPPQVEIEAGMSTFIATNLRSLNFHVCFTLAFNRHSKHKTTSITACSLDASNKTPTQTDFNRRTFTCHQGPNFIFSLLVPPQHYAPSGWYQDGSSHTRHLALSDIQRKKRDHHVLAVSLRSESAFSRRALGGKSRDSLASVGSPAHS